MQQSTELEVIPLDNNPDPDTTTSTEANPSNPLSTSLSVVIQPSEDKTAAQTPIPAENSEYVHTRDDFPYDGFVEYVALRWKDAVRFMIPLYFFVLISIGPVMIVLLPQMYFRIIPYNIDFLGTIEEMSDRDKWQYCCVCQIPGAVGTGAFFIMLRNMLIWDQPLPHDDNGKTNRYCWISTVLTALTSILSCGLNFLRFFGPNTSPWSDMTQITCVFWNFWCVHMATRHNEGAMPRHSVLSAVVVAVDIAYGVQVSQSASFFQSDFFTYTSPFIYSITALFSRKVAEVSTYQIVTAARVCTVSLGFNQIFVRGKHISYLDNVTMMLALEVFYSFLSILTKVTIYYRHALIHKLTSGECKLVVKATERGHCISTENNGIDSVFECGVFTCCAILRQVVDPVAWGQWVSLVLACLAIQCMNNVLSLLVTGYIERVDLNRVRQAITWNTFKRDAYFYCLSLSVGHLYFIAMLVKLWYPMARTQVL